MFLKDILFPKTCLGCGYLGVYLCEQCRRKLTIINKDVCIYCQKRSFGGFTHPGCMKKNYLDGFLALYCYTGLLQRIIKTIKYRLSTDVWLEICQIIKPTMLQKLNFYKLFQSIPVLQSIPLHPNKLKSRGFNQADLIANLISKLLGYKIVDYVNRIRETKPQAEETIKNRYINIKAAFNVKKHIQEVPDTIILIDDVLTSGSTMKETCKILKKGGVKKIYGFVIAKG